MLKDLFLQIKCSLPHLSFNRKKKTILRLKESFGKLKDESFDFERIEHYFRSKKNSDVFQILSDKTCNDLDFNELFMFLDRTHSKVGQQYLYNKLRAIKLDKSQTEKDESIIAELSEDIDLRISIQQQLDGLKNKDAYYISTLFQEEHLPEPKWFFIIKLLALASLISLVLTFFIPKFFIATVALFITNFVFHYWNKTNLIKYVDSIPQLLRMNHVASELFTVPQLKVLNPNLQKSIKLINEVKTRMSFFQLESKLQGDFEVIAWFIFELIKTFFLLEPLLLFGVLKRLNTKRNEIEAVFAFVGHVDSLVSIASLRNNLDNFCLPEINESNHIIANDIHHPLIVNCETNSIEIIKKSILLTGSNMSGKTSFIRAIGLNILTGLTINTCFAKSISFPLLKIFSAIRITDDVMNDKSYYFEEVTTIKEMINQSEKNEKSLFLMDEIFKGTNTVERIAGGKAVLSALAKGNNIVMVSTHDIELTKMLSQTYDLYHFSEVVADKTVGFDYKLKKGALKKRNAIRILEINDYPTEVIQEAKQISNELDLLNKME